MKILKEQESLVQVHLFLLCDIQSLLPMRCVLPFFESMNSLLKFAQNSEVFVTGYMTSIYIFHGEMYELYFDPVASFNSQHF